MKYLFAILLLTGCACTINVRYYDAGPFPPIDTTRSAK
jgi:hypothetical protein